MAEPVIPSWKCEFIKGAERGPVLNSPLTVGEIFGLSCNGESAKLNGEKIRITEAGKEKTYTLKILKVNSLSESSGEFEVTTYQPGEHKNVSFVLSDGSGVVKLEPLGLNVRSVIPPGPPPEPFGPFGPWKMSWPLWWWLVLAVALILVALISWRKYRQVSKRRKLRLEVEEYRKRHSPFDEFQKELRQMQRKLERGAGNPVEMLQNLQRDFKLFLTRTLVVPATDLQDRGLRREIWKRHRRTFKKEVHQELARFLTELKRADRPDISAGDVAQLVAWAQNLSETVDEAATGSAA